MRRLVFDVLFALLVVGLLGASFFVFSRVVLDHPGPLLVHFRGEPIELMAPLFLGIIVLWPILLYGLRFSLADLPWQQRISTVALRTLFLASIAVALARPTTKHETERVTTVFLVDVSDSVTDVAIERARETIQAALAVMPKENNARLITFAERPRLETLARNADGSANAEQDEVDPATLKVPSTAELRHRAAAAAAASSVSGAPSVSGTTSASASASSATMPGQEPARGTEAGDTGAGSNIQAALELAYGVYPPATLKRALLFSDGVETQGDLLSQVERAQHFGVKLHAAPYTEPPPGEVALQNLVLPSKVAIGEPFKIRAEIYASRANTARARLYQGEMLNGLDGLRQLELQPGINSVEFQSVVRIGGDVSYRLTLDEIKDDHFEANNQITTRLQVPGRPQILYIEGQPQRASYLTSALNAQQFDVDVRPAAAFPASLAEMERYEFLIVSDVPAEQVSVSSQDLIERYVRDMGGGLLFAGGEMGFGLGGWSHTTIERILPVTMDAERKKEMPTVAMALVIDRSGSMSGLPLEMAKAACSATLGTLKADDLIEVIAFDASPNRYVKLQPARYQSRIQNEIQQIQSGGGTAIFPALDAAYQDLSVIAARKKHVILLTDGRAEAEGIRDLAQAMVAESITVTTVGLGDGTDADLLRSIAEYGGGRFHAVPDPNSLPRIFTRETEMISRQAAVEEWFPVVRTGNADFLKGIAVNTAPMLHGYVATQMKSAPAQQILASDQGEPILARWRVGLGQTLAWTSDLKNNWAIDWLRWSGFSRFFGQLVREHMRKQNERELNMTTTVVGDRVTATVDAFTPDERFDNGIIAKLVVEHDQSKRRTEVPLLATAPGRYEASFPLDAYGSFTLKADHLREQKDGSLRSIGVSYGRVAYPYPKEYASFEPELERLTRAAVATGGLTNPTPAQLFDPGEQKITESLALWPRALFVALGVFLLDLLLRRVRMFDRKFIAR